MIHSQRKLAAGGIILALLLTQASFAQQPQSGAPEKSVRFASAKLWRGVVNTVTGVGEMVRQPIVCTREDGAIGVPVGIINGVFMSVVRTGAGLLEVFTFPVALDETLEFRSPMNPPYVWQKAD